MTFRIPSLFLDDPGPQSCEELRVVSRELDKTVVRLVRTESSAHPEEWELVTDRMPETWTKGFVGRMWFTPCELDYLQGRRELP